MNKYLVGIVLALALACTFMGGYIVRGHKSAVDVLREDTNKRFDAVQKDIDALKGKLGSPKGAERP